MNISKQADTQFKLQSHYGCTVRQIAVELKRYPVSAINKLAKYLDDDSIHNCITQELYDVPVPS
ncbi:hypothetical protein FA039_29780 [Escherichia coli]|nr:hypothetical protein [Escherichia coli]